MHHSVKVSFLTLILNQKIEIIYSSLNQTGLRPYTTSSHFPHAVIPHPLWRSGTNSPTKIHFGLNHNSHPEFSKFAQNFQQSYIYVINEIGKIEPEMYFPLDKIPSVLISGLIKRQSWFGVYFKTAPVKRIFNIVYFLILSHNFAPLSVKVGRYFSVDIGDQAETSFRQIFYIFPSPSKLEDVAAKFSPTLSFGLLRNEDAIPSDIFIIILTKSLQIEILLYLCRQCEFLTFHLHQVDPNSNLADFVEKIHARGLNYVWKLAHHEVSGGSTLPPFSQKITLQQICGIGNSRLIEGLLLQMLFNNQTNSKWLKIRTIQNAQSHLPMIITRLNSYTDNFFNHVILDMDDYNFITCNGVETDGLDFGAYINPFDKWVWLCVGLSVMCGALLNTAASFTTLPQIERRDFKSDIMISLRFAYDMAFSLICPIKVDFKTESWLKFGTIGVFLWSGITITNEYISVGISNVIAPKSESTKWREIGQIENATLLIDGKTTEGNYSEVYSSLQVDLQHALNGCPYSIEISNIDSASKYFCRKTKNIFDQLNGTRDALVQIGERMSVNSCARKIFYVDRSSKIMDGLIRLKQFFPGNFFYAGQETFHEERIGWKVSKIGRGMFDRLNRIVTAGIYKVFQELSKFNGNLELYRIKQKQNNAFEFKSQNLDSNGVIIFYLYMFCVSGAMVGFLVEQFCNQITARSNLVEITPLKWQ
ncbi:hypothetical protein Fcan01_25022 [Folsomia candida]|uniref:Uncharacterized protein n=1 Tax=Folsomia candida TaxID=158441 RepID=A0A226D3M8_FOLCA|nr:hypothetical protein Fcan01_25022 [Folsomia candida]